MAAYSAPWPAARSDRAAAIDPSGGGFGCREFLTDAAFQPAQHPSRRTFVEAHLFLTPRTPSQVVGEFHVAVIPQQHAATAAPHQLSNLAVFEDEWLTPPAALAMQPSSLLVRLVPWEASQLPGGGRHFIRGGSALGILIPKA